MPVMNPNLTSATPKTGLKRKLVLSMLLVGALPLLIGLALAFYLGTQKIHEVNGASFEALATETARKLDLVVGDEISRTANLATNIHVIEELETRRDALAELTTTEISDLLAQEQIWWEAQEDTFVEPLTSGPIVKMLEQHMGGTYIDPGHPVPVISRSATRALYITDLAGRVVASLEAAMPYQHRETEWWIGAFHKGVGQPYISPIRFDERFQTFTFTLALPIMDRLRYETVGVLRRIYDAKEFFAASIDTIRFGDTGHVMLIDSHGMVLSCPLLPTGTVISDQELVSAVTPLHPGWTRANSDGHGGHESSIIGFAPIANTSYLTRDSTGIAWHMFVWQSSEELFGPIQQFFSWTTGFGLLGVGLLVALGYLAAHRISAPIRRLQEATRRIGRGEFQEPITISTGDEIEELADEVNRMNQQLASHFAGLKSEVQLKTEEVKYLQESTSQILDSVPDPIIMLTPQNTIQYLNEASKQTFALSGNGALIGTPLFQALKIDSDTQSMLEEELQTLQASSTDREQPTPAKLIAELRDPLAQGGWDNPEGKRREFRLHDRHYRYRWFTVKAAPGKDPGIGLVLRDTTEESVLQDQLIQGEKLASLGVLSAGIGHELNNPLVGVIGLGEAIQDEHNIENIRGYAKDIVQHGKRMASVIRDFTGQLGYKFQESKTSIDVNEQLTRAINVVRAQFPADAVTIHTNLESIPALRAKPYELSQAFTNVLTNAFQAMHDTGTINVTSAADADTIHIRIADTGSGISPTHLPKVFDPFFTTKPQGEGSGLGLTVAHRIVTKLGGQIRLESNLGEGTICHITFPTSLGPPQPGKDT